MSAAARVVSHFDPGYEWTGVGFTKNFIGSPHIDRHDINYQYALSMGNFQGKRRAGTFDISATPFYVLAYSW